MLKLIVSNPEIATPKTMNNVVHLDFASGGRIQIPNAKPTLESNEIDQLVNSLVNEMNRMLDHEDCDSFLFE